MKRTNQQNKAYWQLLREYSEQFNEAGYDFKRVVQLPVRFTPENIHEYMFKPVMTMLYPDIKSTTELSTTQMQKVYETFNAAVAEKLKVSLPWPSYFNES